MATPLLTPVPDCWDNVYHELTVKQLPPRNQPGAVRQNAEPWKNNIFFIIYLELRYENFATHNRLDWGLPPHPTFVLVSDKYASVDFSPFLNIKVRLLWLFQLLWSKR